MISVSTGFATFTASWSIGTALLGRRWARLSARIRSKRTRKSSPLARPDQLRFS